MYLIYGKRYRTENFTFEGVIERFQYISAENDWCISVISQ